MHTAHYTLHTEHAGRYVPSEQDLLQPNAPGKWLTGVNLCSSCTSTCTSGVPPVYLRCTSACTSGVPPRLPPRVPPHVFPVYLRVYLMCTSACSSTCTSTCTSACTSARTSTCTSACTYACNSVASRRAPGILTRGFEALGPGCSFRQQGHTLHCTALHCTALHCTALHCTALHCTCNFPYNVQHLEYLSCHEPSAVARCRGTEGPVHLVHKFRFTTYHTHTKPHQIAQPSQAKQASKQTIKLAAKAGLAL
jgi:hypothetical protein